MITDSIPLIGKAFANMLRLFRSCTRKQADGSELDNHHCSSTGSFLCRFSRTKAAPQPTSQFTQVKSLSSAVEISAFEEYIEVTSPPATGNTTSTKTPKLKLHYIWLRDHCQCDQCYNHKTMQRQLDIFQVPLNIQPTAITAEDSCIQLIWPDGHQTSYTFDWLLRNCGQHNHELASVAVTQLKTPKILWSADFFKKHPLPTVAASELESADGLKKHLKNMLQYGFSIITEAPPTAEATESLCQKVCQPYETIFGRFWTLSADSTEHADTAYSKQELRTHTDNTYYVQTPGTQVFHCLEHSEGTGGETLLVDGFYCAEKLRKNNLHYFKFLTSTAIPHEYLEDKVHLLAEEPVLMLDPNQNLLQIRYNYYDRAPLSNLKPDQVMEFYRSYAALTKIIRAKENEFVIKLKPGMVLFIDNWRVLHGRQSFTGKRVLTGCYLSRDNLLNKARVMKL